MTYQEVLKEIRNCAFKIVVEADFMITSWEKPKGRKFHFKNIGKLGWKITNLSVKLIRLGVLND
jgi:hypothetical protein